MRRLHILLAATLCVFALLPDLFGQANPPLPRSEGWRGRVIPYLWGSGFDGTVGIGDRSAKVDASFADLFRELNFAFTTAFLADRDRFTTLTDLIFMNLSDERATAGPLFSSADATAKSLIVSPTAGYRL